MSISEDTTKQEEAAPRRKAKELYRRARNSTVLFVALLGAGVGYESGPGWGIAAASGVLAVFFGVSAIVEGCVGMVGIVAEAVAIARRDELTRESARHQATESVLHAVGGIHGTVINKDDLVAALTNIGSGPGGAH